MAEFTLEATPTLGGVDLPIGENRITERSDFAMVSIAIPLGDDGALSGALKSGWSLAVPEPTRSTVSGETRAIRTAPDQIMLIFVHDEPQANTLVQSRLNGSGYTTDQTDVWVILDVSGPDTLAALERICPLDLHAESFPPNATGRTIMEHMGAIIIRLEADRFLLLSASSSAGSFLHAVETSYRHVTWGCRQSAVGRVATTRSPEPGGALGVLPRDHFPHLSATGSNGASKFISCANAGSGNAGIG